MNTLLSLCCYDYYEELVEAAAKREEANEREEVVAGHCRPCTVRARQVHCSYLVMMSLRKYSAYLKEKRDASGWPYWRRNSSGL